MMAFEDEFARDMEVMCFDCNTVLKSEVLNTPAGYYVGHFCPNCGPYDRQTEYMTKEMAEQTLTMWEDQNETLFTRSTEFNND